MNINKEQLSSCSPCFEGLDPYPNPKCHVTSRTSNLKELQGNCIFTAGITSLAESLPQNGAWLSFGREPGRTQHALNTPMVLKIILPMLCPYPGGNFRVYRMNRSICSYGLAVFCGY